MKIITTMVFDIIARSGADLFMSGQRRQRVVAKTVGGAPVFSCGCFALGPTNSSKWQASLPGDVQFIRLSFFPLNLWQACAGLYYTVRGPGLSERIHAQTFSKTYNRRNPLNDNGQMAAFLLSSKHARDC